MTARESKPVWLLAGLLVIGLALGACREDEQGRVVWFEKGVYLGNPDTPISADTRRALNARSQYQNGRAGSSGGGSPFGAGPDVRPQPASTMGAAPTPIGVLRERARLQGGD